MNIGQLINIVKKHPDYEKIGMILCHNGVVRGTSLSGRKTSGLKVTADHNRLNQVINRYKKKTGIVEILVEINENKNLSPGEDVMLLVVAGDIRENVIPVLKETLNAIKTNVIQKTEFYCNE